MFEEHKLSLNKRIDELNQKYSFSVKDNENLIKELKELKNTLYDKEIKLDNLEHDVRELRIAVLEEKELT